jgi:hypothetical protein
MEIVRDKYEKEGDRGFITSPRKERKAIMYRP